MRLHAKMAIAAVACAIPATALTLWLDARAQRQASEETLIAFVRERASGSRARCEAGPAAWSGVHAGGPRGAADGRPPPGPPPDHPPHDAPRGPPPGAPPPMGREGRAMRPARVYAFDAELRPQSPDAPAISSALREAWTGQGVAVGEQPFGSIETEVLVRMPWDGPCAVMLGRGTTEPGFRSRLLPSSWVWLTPVGVVIAAVLLALLPLVRRVRRLTHEVGRSARSGYAGSVTIEGSDEVTDLARAFARASSEIREQLAERDRRELALREFLANTTHDVMIPLTVLQGHLTTLHERRADADAADPALVSAMDEAHYIASILQNLAASARLDATTLEPRRHRVDLAALVGRVLARHKPIARKLEIELDGATPELEATALADVTLLEQAVSNLVYNAVRHNETGGHVAVVLSREGGSSRGTPASGSGESSAPGFSVKVIDDGPGIPEDQVARLLERGMQGDAARSRSSGQGLGLAIAKRVCDVHGFTLALRPSEYGGLEAEITGPLVEPEA